MPDILERHHTWDVDERFVLPTLRDFVVNGEVDHDTIDVTHTYYDTPDHDLRAHGIELRRRADDDDDRVGAAGGDRLLAWREIEVDAGAGAGSVTKRLTRRLRAAGAHPSRHQSELARVAPERRTEISVTPATQALVAYLRT